MRAIFRFLVNFLIQKYKTTDFSMILMRFFYKISFYDIIFMCKLKWDNNIHSNLIMLIHFKCLLSEKPKFFNVKWMKD